MELFVRMIINTLFYYYSVISNLFVYLLLSSYCIFFYFNSNML